MQAEQVAEYLAQNPRFFEDYADILADIKVPHPQNGQAIPISERQVHALREKNRLLEAKLMELIQFGEENDVIAEKVHRLTLDLMSATDKNEVIAVFYEHMVEGFSVPHVVVRTWRDAHDEVLPVSDTIKALATQLETPYCGSHVTDEVKEWFGEQSHLLSSFAQIRLTNNNNCYGLLVLASESSERFYPEMGTLYLNRIGEIVSAALR